MPYRPLWKYCSNIPSNLLWSSHHSPGKLCQNKINYCHYLLWRKHKSLLKGCRQWAWQLQPGFSTALPETHHPYKSRTELQSSSPCPWMQLLSSGWWHRSHQWKGHREHWSKEQQRLTITKSHWQSVLQERNVSSFLICKSYCKSAVQPSPGTILLFLLTTWTATRLWNFTDLKL